MKITDKINMEMMRKAWADKADTSKSFLWDKEAALSPATQAQHPENDNNFLLYKLSGVYTPWTYTGFYDECLSWHHSCYIGDWSWLNKMLLKGPNVWKCLEASTIANYRNFKIGRAKHIISIRPDGKLLGEGIAFRKSENEALCTGGPTCSEGIMLQTKGFDVELKDMTAEIFNYHVQGPKSLFVLEKACGESLRDISFGAFRSSKIAGRDVFVYRGGMSLEIGYELFGSSADGSVIWNAVVEAGKEFGIRQLGMRSLNSNHIEAFFPTQYVDYMPAIFPKEMEAQIGQAYCSPVDFNWTKVIDFERDFPGKDVLLDEMKNPKRKPVTLEWNNDDVIAIYASLFDKSQEPLEYMPMPNKFSEGMNASSYGFPVQAPDGQIVGYTMSRGYSAFFRRVLSIALMAPQFTSPGAEVCVLYGSDNGRKMKVRATVQKVPYSTDHRRDDVTKM